MKHTPASLDSIISRTTIFVGEKMKLFEAVHDLSHVSRVCKNAVIIGLKEGADMLIIQLAALLHDLPDPKLTNPEEGMRAIESFLQSLPIEDETKNHVIAIIRHMSFKDSFTSSPVNTIEFQVVQDADRLDAIGAIGIARAFHYGGSRNRKLHDPESKPGIYHSKESYVSNQSTTLNHFYEKLLLLKERMNTKTAREMAETRHAFMQEFVNRFLSEWDAKT